MDDWIGGGGVVEDDDNDDDGNDDDDEVGIEEEEEEESTWPEELEVEDWELRDTRLGMVWDRSAMRELFWLRPRLSWSDEMMMVEEEEEEVLVEGGENT